RGGDDTETVVGVAGEADLLAEPVDRVVELTEVPADVHVLAGHPDDEEGVSAAVVDPDGPGVAVVVVGPAAHRVAQRRVRVVAAGRGQRPPGAVRRPVDVAGPQRRRGAARVRAYAELAGPQVERAVPGRQRGDPGRGHVEHRDLVALLTQDP